MCYLVSKWECPAPPQLADVAEEVEDLSHGLCVIFLQPCPSRGAIEEADTSATQEGGRQSWCYGNSLPLAF